MGNINNPGADIASAIENATEPMLNLTANGTLASTPLFCGQSCWSLGLGVAFVSSFFHTAGAMLQKFAHQQYEDALLAGRGDQDVGFAGWGWRRGKGGRRETERKRQRTEG